VIQGHFGPDHVARREDEAATAVRNSKPRAYATAVVKVCAYEQLDPNRVQEPVERPESAAYAARETSGVEQVAEPLDE
jgi:hypothetical protein